MAETPYGRCEPLPKVSAKRYETPDHIRANWSGISWIIEMITGTVIRRGHQVPRAHYFLTSLRTKPEALLRLIRQRWSIENEWHWPRDTQLHEDAHR